MLFFIYAIVGMQVCFLGKCIHYTMCIHTHSRHSTTCCTFFFLFCTLVFPFTTHETILFVFPSVYRFFALFALVLFCQCYALGLQCFGNIHLDGQTEINSNNHFMTFSQGVLLLFRWVLLASVVFLYSTAGFAPLLFSIFCYVAILLLLFYNNSTYGSSKKT